MIHVLKSVVLAAAIALAAAGTSSAFAAATKQKSFASPEEAAKELAAAVKNGDSKAMLAILGSDAKSLIQSGDAVADRTGRERFVKNYEESNKLDKAGESKAVLSTGKDDWPFPIPIVKNDAGWRFDTKAGKQEVLNRRIGRNELAVMQVAQAYADAQREYYLRNTQNDKMLQYAQKFVSAKGKRDGLYWPAKADEPPSPLGPLMAQVRAKGYAPGETDAGKPAPYYGYHYRILKAQGPDARGGAYDYVVRGKMFGGFALLAYPAGYGSSGVMTFIVSHEGVVYEKDLGPGTAGAAQKIARFNPDKSWKKSGS
jgi:type II secretory pathway pseudopilin PulG